MGNNIVEHTLNKVVFLDRDGTLNEEVNYLHKPEDMKLLPGVPQALKKLKDAGYNPGTIDGVAGSNTLAACPTLKSGSKGTLVTLLQERLYYFFGLAISGGIDGDFGTGTKNAVISFQKNCGLSADGIVGTNTWRKLLSL